VRRLDVIKKTEDKKMKNDKVLEQCELIDSDLTDVVGGIIQIDRPGSGCKIGDPLPYPLPRPPFPIPRPIPLPFPQPKPWVPPIDLDLIRKSV
jgi:hypothetical protein